MSLPIDQIICGDNVETLSGFPDECIDLVVTSPPYDNLRTYGGHSWDFEGVAQQLWRTVKPGGVVVWVVADQTIDGSESGESFRQALRFKEIGFRLHDTMIWRKTDAAPGDAKYRYHQQFEYMFVISKGRPSAINLIRDSPNQNAGRVETKKWDRRRDESNAPTNRGTHYVRNFMGCRFNVWDTRKAGTKDSESLRQPAIYPEALARDHILSWSNLGDIVCDPFNGSGTTTKMARETGRQYIGIEVNPEYCEIARKRLEQKLLFT